MNRILASAALALVLAAPVLAAPTPAERAHPAHAAHQGHAMTGAPGGERRAKTMHRRHAHPGHHAHAGGLAPGAGLLGVGHGGADRVEGRIAFLRAELAITDAQGAAWNGFAEALRANAARPSERGAPGEGALARLESAEKRLSDRLETVRTTRAALAELSQQLDEAQRQTLDELLAPHRPARR